VAQNLVSFKEDLDILKAHSEEHQEPFAAVLSCADSRVPVELVFDQSIGHLFVVRVAGNVATPDTIASLEYGAAVLGTKAILVLGHTNCGAVKATMAGKAVPGQISTLVSVHPSRDRRSQRRPDQGQPAKCQSASVGVARASPVLAELVKQKKLAIVVQPLIRCRQRKSSPCSSWYRCWGGLNRQYPANGSFLLCVGIKDSYVDAGRSRGKGDSALQLRGRDKDRGDVGA
jgi:carbonic anhydrase